MACNSTLPDLNTDGVLSQFIIISTVIGAGIFSNGGTAMGVAGPAGALVALLVMSRLQENHRRFPGTYYD
jgi:hypothetical protein